MEKFQQQKIKGEGMTNYWEPDDCKQVLMDLKRLYPSLFIRGSDEPISGADLMNDLCDLLDSAELMEDEDV